MNRERPLVMFSITNGWGVRNFLHTGLFDAVSTFADIGVAASEELLPFFQQVQEQGKIASVVALPSKEPVLGRWVRLAKKAILQAGCGISTARIKWQAKARGTVEQCCRSGLWHLLQTLSARWQIRALECLENSLTSDDLPQILEHPELVVNCSPFDFRDNSLLRTMHRRGVRSMAIIPSWDNPSTKGCIPTCADLVLVWGSAQMQELLNFYPNLDPSRIRISGIPQFDMYYNGLAGEFTRERFFSRLSIAPGRKVLLYATCSERLFPTEHEVVAQVATALERGCFGNNSHLLIRCHPADRVARYQHLCSSGRVTIYPSSQEHGQNLYRWIPPDHEIAVLAATLRHSELCINTASTMTLDAFACGKPVVNVAYDGEAELPYLQSVRRYYDYHHYSPIARSGAVMIARSVEELVDSIARSLNEPEQLQPYRKAVLDALCFYHEPGSVEFITKEIERLVR